MYKKQAHNPPAKSAIVVAMLSIISTMSLGLIHPPVWRFVFLRNFHFLFNARFKIYILINTILVKIFNFVKRKLEKKRKKYNKKYLF